MARGETTYNDYDGFAREYGRNNESSPYNALYERPAILALAGDVSGLRVLDAGCGTGLHAEELVRRGAAVTGIDLSKDMLAVARERLGPDVPLHQADLTQPLVFEDNSFELVLSSLVMHYMQDWVPPLREFRRVLVPGGRLVFSTHHPFTDMRISGNSDYLGTYTYTEDWVRGERTMRMRFWHRPLRAMFAAFDAAGFTVDTVDEPDPQPEMAESAPEAYRKLSVNSQFLFFALTPS
jgi:SAM-dependent methyltransferase